MAKLFITQSEGGNVTIKSEWADNENGARVAFHSTCADLINDKKVQKALVQITDEDLKEWGGYREEIDKTKEDPETITGKLFVQKVSNDNLLINQITEWIPNKAGRDGALVDFHTKCAGLWSAPDVVTGSVMILDEHLKEWNKKSEFISHIQEPEEENE